MNQFTDTNFDQFLSSNKPLVVDFYADWCKPCSILSPVFQKVAANLSQQAEFGKLDIELNPNISMKYNISSLPTILVFKDGKPVGRLTGLVNESKLAEAIQKAL